MREYVRRRGNFEPVQYITGEGAFRAITVAAGPGVLIPRPETEVLAGEVLKDSGKFAEKSAMLDMGCGSGVIALCVKKHCLHLRVTGADISADALALAGRNAGLLGLDVEWVESDLFAALKGRRFSLIAANLPYVRTGDMAGLPREVREYEPALALDGGPDGLDPYRHFLKEGPGFIVPGGRIYLEAGDDQAAEIVKTGVEAGWTHERTVKDLANKDRVIIFSGTPRQQ
jgi:release factor glutamine methyltransferase